MAVSSEMSLAVLGGPLITVSWKAPGSKTWRLSDHTARAILLACASEQATLQLEGDGTKVAPAGPAGLEEEAYACGCQVKESLLLW